MYYNISDIILFKRTEAVNFISYQGFFLFRLLAYYIVSLFGGLIVNDVTSLGLPERFFMLRDFQTTPQIKIHSNLQTCSSNHLISVLFLNPKDYFMKMSYCCYKNFMTCDSCSQYQISKSIKKSFLKAPVIS